MHVFTLVVIGLLCLAFKSTRIFGLVALTLLSLVFPLLFLALLISGGAFFFIYRRYCNHEFRLPKLFDRSN